MNILKLGIIENKGKIVNHRSLIKVLFNPFLRIFGIQIGTLYFPDSNKLGYPTISKCNKLTDIKFSFESNEYDKIVKKRMII